MNSAEKLAVAHAALRRIAAYSSPEKLERLAERDYGVTAGEAVEMAYENVLAEAKGALKVIGRLPRPALAPSGTKP